MQFLLDRNTNDLVLGPTKGTNGFGLQMFGGRIIDSELLDQDELRQLIKNELLLWANENENVSGRGSDWFFLLSRSKQNGIAELRAQISSVLLSIRSIAAVMNITAHDLGNRNYRISFQVQSKRGEVVDGDLPLY